MLRDILSFALTYKKFTFLTILVIVVLFSPDLNKIRKKIIRWWKHR